MKSTDAVIEYGQNWVIWSLVRDPRVTSKFIFSLN